MPLFMVSFRGREDIIPQIGPRSHAGIAPQQPPYRTPKCRRYPPKSSSGPWPMSATFTSCLARSQTKYIGTIDEDAIGSSSDDTIFCNTDSYVPRFKMTEVWRAANCFAVFSASLSSSSVNVDPYPTV